MIVSLFYKGLSIFLLGKAKTPHIDIISNKDWF